MSKQDLALYRRLLEMGRRESEIRARVRWARRRHEETMRRVHAHIGWSVETQVFEETISEIVSVVEAKDVKSMVPDSVEPLPKVVLLEKPSWLQRLIDYALWR